MTSPPSGSDEHATDGGASAGGDADAGASAFSQLHPSIQRWVYRQGWTELRDAQARAVPLIVPGERDVIISAATAAGKTEAAFLPILTYILDQRAGAATGVPDGPGDAVGVGLDVLYVSPLKALINDQYGRLELLTDSLDINVHRWHGDVPGNRKAKVLDAPAGILLITPESLEALFVIHGEGAAYLFGGLAYVVVDELHAFIGTERGAQLQSLLHRVELTARHHIPRIALSATLGDLNVAAEFLRPGHGTDVARVEGDGDTNELLLQLRGYRVMPPKLDDDEIDVADAAGIDVAAEDVVEGDKVTIAEHLYAHLRGADNLVFINSRRDVEEYADLLASIAERRHVPNEFLPHHGSLSKELREHVEDRLRDGMPITALCTSTLELGIDIGDVASVAQIGAPPSVASLRQRLGRSGRRDDPAVLRVYVTENEITDRTAPADSLRAELVESIAMIELLLEGWLEAPRADELHLSTLVQQLLSLITQHGGVQPAQAHQALCGHGPFRLVTAAMFAQLLRGLGGHDLIVQASDGLLLLGGRGERIVNHYSFYAAFVTPDEYRLVADGHQIGTLPVDRPIVVGQLIIFAGRRWRVLGVDVEHKIIDLTRARAARPPKFPGDGGHVDTLVRERMREIYQRGDTPTFLNRGAADLLAEGRANYARHGLRDRSVIVGPSTVTLFPWRGDRAVHTATIELAGAGLTVSADGLAITVEKTEPAQLADIVKELAAKGPADPLAVAALVPAKAIEKYDRYLLDDLLDAAFASRALDTTGAWEALVTVRDDLLRKTTGDGR